MLYFFKKYYLNIILFLYLIFTIIIQNIDIKIYKIINPLFWIVFSIYIIFFSRKKYFRFYKKKFYIEKISILTLIHIVLIYCLGFFVGFGKNPYSNTFTGIIKNCIEIIIPIIGVEISRYYMINSNSKNKTNIFIMTIILFLLEIKYSYIFTNLSNRELIFKYFCSNIIPLLANSFLFSYLTMLGSYTLSLIYRLSEELLFIILPIIPNINWFVSASSSLIFTALIYILFKHKYKKNLEYKSTRNPKKITVSYSITIFITIAFICFMLGFFKYEPIAIVSNSMLPTYARGDVVIYEKKTPEALKKLENGCIIIYKVGNITVAHRITKMINDNDTILYETKGDNNDSADARLVSIEQILGVYVCSIQYMGYPSVWLNDYFNHQSVEIETK